MMDETLIFVDDGFFRLVKSHFQERTGKKLKFLQTFKNISHKENLSLKHLFVYMAPPFQSRTPTDDEKNRKRKYDTMKKMLDKKGWVTVREGRCQKIFDREGRHIFNQKGVDSWIVADLCLFRDDYPHIKKIILISSDSDFAPIIQLVKNKMNIDVLLYTFFENARDSQFYRSNHLLKVCSKWVKLDESLFEENQEIRGGIIKPIREQ